MKLINSNLGITFALMFSLNDKAVHECVKLSAYKKEVSEFLQGQMALGYSLEDISFKSESTILGVINKYSLACTSIDTTNISISEEIAMMRSLVKDDIVATVKSIVKEFPTKYGSEINAYSSDLLVIPSIFKDIATYHTVGGVNEMVSRLLKLVFGVDKVIVVYDIGYVEV